MFTHFDQLAGTPHRLCRSAQSPLSSSNLCSSNLCSWATGDWSLPLICILRRRSSYVLGSSSVCWCITVYYQFPCRTLTLMYLIHHLSMIIRLSWRNLYQLHNLLFHLILLRYRQFLHNYYSTSSAFIVCEKIFEMPKSHIFATCVSKAI
jgi:hypothetical protein